MTDKIDLKRLASVVRSVQSGEVVKVDMEDERLHAMGYEQHMKRGFTLWSMIAFCLTGLGLLPSVGGTYDRCHVLPSNTCAHALS
jgi:hypothetical protein